MRRSRTAGRPIDDDGPLPPLRYELAERAERNARAGGNWSMDHLRIPAIAMAALAVLSVAVALPFGGTAALFGALIGLVVVTAFFTVSTWVVARAGEVNYRYTMPAALITYGIKFALLALLLATFPQDGPVDRVWVGGAIGVGVMVWIACQVIVVWRTPMMYVDLSAAENPASPAAEARNTAGGVQ